MPLSSFLKNTKTSNREHILYKSKVCVYVCVFKELLAILNSSDQVYRNLMTCAVPGIKT